MEVKAKGNSLVELQEYLAELSSVVRDKSPKSAEKLWGRLLTESVGNKASRVFEYIPCKIDKKIDSGQYFGFYLDDNYYTNARELLNWGWSMREVLRTVDFTNYKVFRCEAPRMVYNQVQTHTQITSVCFSARYSDNSRGFWKPNEVDMLQEEWDNCVENSSPKELKEIMRYSGVVRKEILNRGRDNLQYVVFNLGGYTNNPNAWEHFVAQRTDSHTQLETRELVTNLVF